MADEKDRLGDKLRDVEKAREDQWAWEQDRKLMEKLRERMSSGDLLCPKCHEPLRQRSERGIVVMACPKEEGVWLDANSLKRLFEQRP